MRMEGGVRTRTGAIRRHVAWLTAPKSRIFSFPVEKDDQQSG